MKTLMVLTGLLLLLAAPAAAADITFDKTRIDAVVGQRFTLETRISNPGAEPAEAVLAHLNLASLTSDVYVDPEDWSSERSQQVDELEPGETTTLTWDVQAVTVGSFSVYAVLLPSAGRGPLVVSPPVQLAVAARQTLSAGGALPIVLVVPVLLGLGAAAVRYRARRTR
ncbi:MAG: hypothetical protein QOI21_2585 [Actinomycetota bacterium]|jgi:hypothetical protein|nr:hypothetical protein [Actinomycetota bacterium]